MNEISDTYGPWPSDSEPKTDEIPTTSVAQPPDGGHWSDCPVNNAPALPVGPCTCGGLEPAASERDYIITIEVEGRRLVRKIRAATLADALEKAAQSLRP